MAESRQIATQTILKELCADMSEVKKFIVRMEPIIDQVGKHNETLYANNSGLVMRVKLIEEFHRIEASSIGKRLGYEAIKIVMSGVIMAIIVFILGGGLVR